MSRISDSACEIKQSEKATNMKKQTKKHRIPFFVFQQF